MGSGRRPAQGRARGREGRHEAPLLRFIVRSITVTVVSSLLAPLVSGCCGDEATYDEPGYEENAFGEDHG